MKLKICTKCNVERDIKDFHKDITKKDGYYPSCKYCRSPLEYQEKKHIDSLIKNGFILCPKCNQWVTKDDFYYRKTGKRLWWCKKCLCAARKIRYHTDPDYRQYNINKAIEWNKKNPEKSKASIANWKHRWYLRNKPRAIDKGNSKLGKLRQHLWQDSNKKNSSGIKSPNTNGRNVLKILNYYAPNNICPKCHKVGKITIDHIIPLSLGGDNSLSNIQPLCLECNCGKCNRDKIDYRFDGGEFAMLLENGYSVDTLP